MVLSFELVPGRGLSDLCLGGKFSQVFSSLKEKRQRTGLIELR